MDPEEEEDGDEAEWVNRFAQRQFGGARALVVADFQRVLLENCHPAAEQFALIRASKSVVRRQAE